GTRPLAVSAQDDDGVFGPVTRTVQVAAPAPEAGGPYTVTEGASLTLAGSAPGTGVSFAWDLDDDGAFDDAVGATPTITWSTLQALGLGDNGPSHTLRLRSRYADGQANVDTATL